MTPGKRLRQEIHALPTVADKIHLVNGLGVSETLIEAVGLGCRVGGAVVRPRAPYEERPSPTWPQDDEVEVQLFQPNGLPIEHQTVFVPAKPATDAEYKAYVAARKAGISPADAERAAGL